MTGHKRLYVLILISFFNLRYFIHTTGFTEKERSAVTTVYGLLTINAVLIATA